MLGGCADSFLNGACCEDSPAGIRCQGAWAEVWLVKDGGNVYEGYDIGPLGGS